ncbi:MAG TPA: cyclic nucleotide-binding and patatin-like phospholipase domain-containing protein [Chloroflexota bacterium]|nr:cyclic nucleotide-binding and patatin-like phospholipase domain-containing protein [Chloroflexota bacterium]
MSTISTAVSPTSAHALHLLESIERFTATRLRRARLTIQAFLAGALHQRLPERAGEEPLPALTALDLERFAPVWAPLVPTDPNVAAREVADEVAALVAERYGIGAWEAWPRLREALRRGDGRGTAATTAAPPGSVTARGIDGEDEPLAPLSRLTSGTRAYDALVRALELEMEWVQLEHGEALVRQGEPSDCIYIVVDGRLRVTVNRADGSELSVGEATRWETVGEMGIITGDARSANVYAVRDSELLRLSKAAFDRLMMVVPEVALAISHVLIHRIRALQAPTRRTENTLRTLALVPLDGGVPLRTFARDLQQALAPHGEALCLDAETVRERVLHFPSVAGERRELDANDSSTVAWLNDQETHYRYVLYEADAEATDWTGRCIRQADCVLLVGQAGASARTAQEVVEVLERFLGAGTAGGATRRELVLLRPAGEPARGTAEWLAVHDVATHHHVRAGNAADVGRLARRLAGRAVGLVLGGGGARGFAHLGVVRALEEAGLPIDLVGGSSAGAIVAAQIAAGWDHREMLERTHELLVRAKALVEFTVPLVSFLAARRFNDALDAMFGGVLIEDLSTNYYCVSSNLTRAEVAVHERGSLVNYLRASCSLPGVFPPVLDNGDLLADGVLLDNVPVDVMRGRANGGEVIAVDVSSQIDLNRPYAFDPKLSGQQMLLNRLNPFSRRRIEAPNIMSVIMRAAELGSTRIQLTLVKQADLYVNPPVSDFSTFDVKSFDRIVAMGYETGKRDLERWLAARAEH